MDRVLQILPMMPFPSPEILVKIRGAVTGAAGVIVGAVLSSVWPDGGTKAPAADGAGEDTTPGNGMNG